jgi:hypothetical protein
MNDSALLSRGRAWREVSGGEQTLQPGTELRFSGQEERGVYWNRGRGRHHLESHLAACLWDLLTSLSAPVDPDDGKSGIGSVELRDLLNSA